LEVAVLQRPMSEVNVNQADAAERLIRAVSEVENAVLVIGSLLLVKTTKSAASGDSSPRPCPSPKCAHLGPISTS